ncbi:uncharacterized protein DFL_009400 [Arthrobotrys flagrans]|uniref:Uncharacterized protein n=1 Tax=Arthrobotrys flagrans TaxID=97331 RepID=A0A436ZRH4_ARTFL|nr:hypothetical protein DFL_009400 [Arthrobotrys flagrans]
MSDHKGKETTERPPSPAPPTSPTISSLSSSPPRIPINDEKKSTPNPLSNDPSTWDPLLKVSPKLPPLKHEEKFSMSTRAYRFRDEESRLPALKSLPPTRRYRFDDPTDEGTAGVYPDPELKFKLGRPPFLRFLPLIIVASIRKNVPPDGVSQKPMPTCENLNYPTTIQFDVLDHATVRGNHTGRYNFITISNQTHIGRFTLSPIYDLETIQNDFTLTTREGGLLNVSINYFLRSMQYTVNYHNGNDTTPSPLPEYFGGSWQETPAFYFPNLSPAISAKKLDKWQIKAFSEGSFLDIFKFASDARKPWIRTLDGQFNARKSYMEACAMGGVEDVTVLVPAGVLLIEFAKDVYDTTKGVVSEEQGGLLTYIKKFSFVSAVDDMLVFIKLVGHMYCEGLALELRLY